jgi:hypothetical protein
MFENKIHTPHPRYLSNFVEPMIQVQHDHQINGLEHLLLVVGKVGVCHRENVLRPNFEDFHRIVGSLSLLWVCQTQHPVFITHD